VRRIPPQDTLCYIEQSSGPLMLFHAHPLPFVPRDPSASYISNPHTTRTHNHHSTLQF
jgi:hypothetical protein